MHSSNTCDMYMCRLRHRNDSVLSSLKMEGIRLLFNGIDACIGHNTTRVQHDTVIPCASSYSVYYLSSPTPSATRAHTYDYVTRFKVNIARSSGPSSDVTI
jgi:hypothetical protein